MKVTTNGRTQQGTAYKNIVMFNGTQISTDDGKTGKVTLQAGHKTYVVPVTNYGSSGSSSQVNMLA